MRKILLVDDADILRESLSAALEKRGSTVFQAATGNAAIQLYKKYRPDCVFLDINLPDLDGLNVFESIKEWDSGAKVYFLTGKDNFHIQKKAAELGAIGYILKPVMLNNLIEIIENL